MVGNGQPGEPGRGWIELDLFPVGVIDAEAGATGIEVDDQADIVVAHVVLQRLTPLLPHLDLMEDIESYLGFRISLDNLAKSNLGAAKSGNGLEAIRWWQEGNVEAIKRYCLDDVRITRDIYEFGKKNGHVIAETRNDPKVSVPVSWHMPVTATTAQTSLF